MVEVRCLAVLVVTVCIGLVWGQAYVSCPISAASITACPHPDSWYEEHTCTSPRMYEIHSFESACREAWNIITEAAKSCNSEAAAIHLVQNAVQKGCMMTDGRVVIDSIMIKHMHNMLGSLCPLSGFVRLDTTSQEAGYFDLMPVECSSVRKAMSRNESEIDKEGVKVETGEKGGVAVAEVSEQEENIMELETSRVEMRDTPWSEGQLPCRRYGCRPWCDGCTFTFLPLGEKHRRRMCCQPICLGHPYTFWCCMHNVLRKPIDYDELLDRYECKCTTGEAKTVQNHCDCLIGFRKNPGLCPYNLIEE